jgi:hypothetical protein
MPSGISRVCSASVPRTAAGFNAGVYELDNATSVSGVVALCKEGIQVHFIDPLYFEETDSALTRKSRNDLHHFHLSGDGHGQAIGDYHRFQESAHPPRFAQPRAQPRSGPSEAQGSSCPKKASLSRVKALPVSQKATRFGLPPLDRQQRTCRQVNAGARLTSKLSRARLCPNEVSRVGRSGFHRKGGEAC